VTVTKQCLPCIKRFTLISYHYGVDAELEEAKKERKINKKNYYYFFFLLL
jgi:hypothetical protein